MCCVRFLYSLFLIQHSFFLQVFEILFTVTYITSSFHTVLYLHLSRFSHLNGFYNYTVLVARLAAIEDMAGMSILCSDKTGTLTMNKMEIQEETPIYKVQLSNHRTYPFHSFHFYFYWYHYCVDFYFDHTIIYLIM